MDMETYHRLIEGEALYLDSCPETLSNFSELIATVDSSNDLFHLAAYGWAISLIEGVQGNAVVLDAACGSGYGSNLLAHCSSAVRVIGLDVSKDRVEDAARRWPKPEFHTADITQGMTFLDSGSVDVAVSFQTIEHVMDPVAFIQAFWHALRPDGFFLIGSPTHCGGAHFLPTGNPYHLVEYGPKLLNALCSFFFEEVHMWESLPGRDAFDILFERLPDLIIPKANFIHLSRPKQDLNPQDIEEFRTRFLLNLRKSLIESIQSRLIDERRSESFLTPIYAHIDLISGFNNPELTHVWTKKEAEVVIRNTGEFKKISFSLTVAEQALRSGVEFSVEIQHAESGKLKTVGFSDTRPRVYSLPGTFAENHLTIRMNRTFIPATQGGFDIRSLGVCLFDFRFEK